MGIMTKWPIQKHTEHHEVYKDATYIKITIFCVVVVVVVSLKKKEKKTLTVSISIDCFEGDHYCLYVYTIPIQDLFVLRRLFFSHVRFE